MRSISIILIDRMKKVIVLGGGISGVYGHREKVGTEDRAMCQVNSYLPYKMELLGDFV